MTKAQCRRLSRDLTLLWSKMASDYCWEATFNDYRHPKVCLGLVFVFLSCYCTSPPSGQIPSLKLAVGVDKINQQVDFNSDQGNVR